MDVELGRFGVWRRGRDLTPELAGRIEALGFGALWVGGSPELTFIEDLLDATERIVVATGIVNMWRVDPASLGASYRRVAERHRDRFLLGVGIGHREHFEEYRSPYRTMVEYFDGLDRSGVPVERRVLAALGPGALRLAAERSAGAHPYLTTPEHTRDARDILGDGPLLAPEHKMIWGMERDAARRTARAAVGHYLDLVNYRNNLLRNGWAESDLTDGGSEELVDALVLRGEISSIASRLTDHLDAGADHVCIQVLDDDPVPAYRALADRLLG